MTRLLWDQLGEKKYEIGVDHGVLYLANAGVYDEGYAWNGLTTVTESPSGAEPQKTYADNIVYMNILSLEEFGGTIEAYTYPDQFAECDGSASPQVGIAVGQQNRRTFGMSYRTKIGDDSNGVDAGYKIHLVWGALAAPSEKAYATINDSPEGVAFSWDFSTTPVGITGYPDLKPTASMTIDSTKVDPTALAALEDTLYGTSGVDPALPMPGAILDMFDGTVTSASPTAPTYNGTTHVITIPSVTGVTYKIGGTTVTGTVTLTTGQTKVVRAYPNSGYYFPEGADDDWSFTY